MPFRFRLVTPERVLFEQEVDSVSVPTLQGELTILPHHAVLNALLVSGIIRLKEPRGEEEVAVSGGFVSIGEDGTLTVLAETAERGEELQLDTIRAARERALAVMNNTARTDDVAFAAAAAALERELAREKLALKRHHGHAASLPPTP